MKRKRVWRYYCEFCKKSGCSGGHMKRHEAGCTKNPDRICGMCASTGLKQRPIHELISALGSGDGEGVDRLRTLSNGCPACMLAAINQSGLQYYEEDEEGWSGFSVDFDFASEKKCFWEEHKEHDGVY